MVCSALSWGLEQQKWAWEAEGEVKKFELNPRDWMDSAYKGREAEEPRPVRALYRWLICTQLFPYNVTLQRAQWRPGVWI